MILNFIIKSIFENINKNINLTWKVSSVFICYLFDFIKKHIFTFRIKVYPVDKNIFDIKF